MPARVTAPPGLAMAVVRTADPAIKARGLLTRAVTAEGARLALALTATRGVDALDPTRLANRTEGAARFPRTDSADAVLRGATLRANGRGAIRDTLGPSRTVGARAIGGLAAGGLTTGGRGAAARLNDLDIDDDGGGRYAL